MFNHEGLEWNPLQRETIKLVDKDCNVVVLAPTSSGKTYVAEQFFNKALTKARRCVYLSPLKALTTEKLNDWKPVFGDGICAITSDYGQVSSMRGKRMILMTTESLDSKGRSAPKWFEDVGCVVCDEAHLVGVEGRGDAFEMGLMRFTKLNPDARIVFLSATMPNVDELKEWLTLLNGKPTEIVQTEWRPVQVSYEFIEFSNKEYIFRGQVERYLRDLLKRCGQESKQLMIFVHSIARGQKIAKALRIPFHYSRISKGQRHKIEEDFRVKRIGAIVSTSTLAWGINLPADVGVIVGARRGPDRVEAYDLKQMAGRIGRYGLSENGVVHFLLNERDVEDVEKEMTEIPPIESCLTRNLAFHICSLVVREEHKDTEQIIRWFKRSLGELQGNLTSAGVEMVVKEMIGSGILRDDPIEGLSGSSVARASAMMYFDPFEIISLMQNLKGKPKTATPIAKALANVPSLRYEVSLPEGDKLEMEYSAQTMLATALRTWLNGGEPGYAYKNLLRMYVWDFERLIGALKIAGPGSLRTYYDVLFLMVKNGINWDATELVKLRGVGRTRAMRLSKYGIKNKKQLLDDKNMQLVKRVLGPKLYNSLKNDDGRIILTWS